MYILSGSAMQVETDDFILSLTAGDDVDSNGQTEIVTTEVSDLPPDLVNTDVSELVSLLFFFRKQCSFLLCTNSHNIRLAYICVLLNMLIFLV